MGCGLSTKRTITIHTSAEATPTGCTDKNKAKVLESPSPGQARKSPLCRVSMTNLSSIADYLSFTELREVGKVNRLFNQISKQGGLLLKFFKKKELKKVTCKTVVTFAALQHSSVSYYSTSSDE